MFQLCFNLPDGEEQNGSCMKGQTLTHCSWAQAMTLTLEPNIWPLFTVASHMHAFL